MANRNLKAHTRTSSFPIDPLQLAKLRISLAAEKETERMQRLGTQPPEKRPAVSVPSNGTHAANPEPRQLPDRVNRLDRGEQRKLEDWVSSAWEVVQREKPTMVAAAETASKAVGFPVTESNLRAAAKIMGKEWPRPAQATVNGNRTKSGYLRSIFAQIDALLKETGGTVLPEYAEAKEKFAKRR